MPRGIEPLGTNSSKQTWAPAIGKGLIHQEGGSKKSKIMSQRSRIMSHNPHRVLYAIVKEKLM